MRCCSVFALALQRHLDVTTKAVSLSHLQFVVLLQGTALFDKHPCPIADPLVECLFLLRHLVHGDGQLFSPSVCLWTAVPAQASWSALHVAFDLLWPRFEVNKEGPLVQVVVCGWTQQQRLI